MGTKDSRRSQNRTAPRGEQDVVYTQPKPFNRNRFLLQLATVAAVVLALLFGMSIFFKVADVQISGTVKYDAWAVREASGIQEGENLLTLSKARISSNILDRLPYVDSVRVSIQLPDTVVIQITELEVVYGIQDTTGAWWLLNSDGRIVDSCLSADAEDHTRILGVVLTEPVIGAQAVAFQPENQPDEEGVTVPVTVYESERLAIAVEILQNMEYSGMIGMEYKVDVSDLGDIEIWYGTRFQMLLGNTADLYRKINALSQALAKMDDYEKGVLDASFTYWPDQVGYSQFS